MEIFKLYTAVSNNGDGSVSVHEFTSEAEAEKFDEELEEGWGESSVSSLEFAIIDGHIHFREFVYLENEKKYEYRWRPLERSTLPN